MSVERHGVNRPEILEEISAAFVRYESALLSNDVEALNDFFWGDAAAVRYGLSEQSYGIAAIHAYRKQAAPVDPRRKLSNTVITTYGSDAATVCTEFSIPDTPLLGRQTQTWIRFERGWKIVAAHVSGCTPTI